MPEQRPRCDVLDCKHDRLGRCLRREGVCSKRTVFGETDAPSAEPSEDEVDIE